VFGGLAADCDGHARELLHESHGAGEGTEAVVLVEVCVLGIDRVHHDEPGSDRVSLLDLDERTAG